jgi:hypothetical protein
MSSDFDLSTSNRLISSTATLSPNLEDSLSSLNQKTESMLCTKRLDMLLLGSRGEDMRRLLDRFEDHCESLERMLEDEDAKNEEQKDPNNSFAERRAKRKGSVASTTIDWNVNENINGDGKNDKAEDMGGEGHRDRGGGMATHIGSATMVHSASYEVTGFEGSWQR